MLLEISVDSAYNSVWGFKTWILQETKIHIFLPLYTFKNLPNGKKNIFRVMLHCKTAFIHLQTVLFSASMFASKVLGLFCYVSMLCFGSFLLSSPDIAYPEHPGCREQGIAGKSDNLLLGCSDLEVQSSCIISQCSAFPISAHTYACSMALQVTGHWEG